MSDRDRYYPRRSSDPPPASGYQSSSRDSGRYYGGDRDDRRGSDRYDGGGGGDDRRGSSSSYGRPRGSYGERSSSYSDDYRGGSGGGGGGGQSYSTGRHSSSSSHYRDYDRDDRDYRDRSSGGGGGGGMDHGMDRAPERSSDRDYHRQSYSHYSHRDSRPEPREQDYRSGGGGGGVPYFRGLGGNGDDGMSHSRSRDYSNGGGGGSGGSYYGGGGGGGGDYRGDAYRRSDPQDRGGSSRSGDDRYGPPPSQYKAPQDRGRERDRGRGRFNDDSRARSRSRGHGDDRQPPRMEKQRQKQHELPPPPKKARISSGAKEELIEIALDVLVFHQLKRYVRADYATVLPEKFNIGAIPSFPNPILQPDVFESFSDLIASDCHEGDRRGFTSIVAMPGWGKTYAMNLLAKLTVVCRNVTNDNDGIALSSELEGLEVNQDLLRCCVPLAITLSSSMNLLDKVDSESFYGYYTREIAERLVYSYFADVDVVTFSQWMRGLKKIKGPVWSCTEVLPGLRDLAKKAGVAKPIMLFLIDEPDKNNGASMLLSSLYDTALNYNYRVECRVVMSALEQHWLLTSSSRRPIYPLRVDPPNDAAVMDALAQGLAKQDAKKEVNKDDIREVSEYIGVLAAGHWRTISNIHEVVKKSGQLTCKGLKLFAGRAPPYVPSSWSMETDDVMQQLEEALAHAVVGSKLRFMEPIHNGTVWQAVAKGVILQYLGVNMERTIDAVVPILTVLRLAEKEMYDSYDELFITLRESWSKQDLSDVRNTLLVKVLGISRFVPSCNVSSRQKKHELYENLATLFMMLRWDAYARIDRAVRKRWALDAASLMTVPKQLDKMELENDVEKLRNETNVAWANSLNLTSSTVLPTDRPNLWLVPPGAIVGEADLRLCIFRGAECCTQSKGSIKVLPPEAGKPRHYACSNKLLTKNAGITGGPPKALPSGSVIEPAKGNDGFDSLTVLSKVGGGSAFALIENKFEVTAVGERKVKDKLNTLKRYRGILWRDPDGRVPKQDDLKRLGLPLVNESDIVWVLLVDVGYTTILAGHIRQELESTDMFQGHVLLTTSKEFFGPCFSKVGILDQNKKR